MREGGFEQPTPGGADSEGGFNWPPQKGGSHVTHIAIARAILDSPGCPRSNTATHTALLHIDPSVQQQCHSCSYGCLCVQASNYIQPTAYMPAARTKNKGGRRIASTQRFAFLCLAERGSPYGAAADLGVCVSTKLGHSMVWAVSAVGIGNKCSTHSTI